MLQGLFSRHPRVSGAVIGCLGIVAMSGAPARAALISTSACDSSTLTQPFSVWGDANQYKLVPGGTFEDGGAGWTLAGGAAIASGSEPFGATGSVGSSSLNLPAGASATSPYTCVNAAYPTFRFFAHNLTAQSAVAVAVVYQLPTLGQVVVPVGVVAADTTWQPTVPMLTASAVPGLLAGGTAHAAFRFTAVSGDSRIDDLFVDPHMRA